MSTRKVTKIKVKEKRPFLLFSFETQNYNLKESWIEKLIGA